MSPYRSAFAKTRPRSLYHPSLSPMCCRCTLITGRHSGHCTVRSNGPTLTPNDTCVGTVMKQAGYDTAHIGKWGLGDIGSPGDPLTTGGFDVYFGQTDQAYCHNCTLLHFLLIVNALVDLRILAHLPAPELHLRWPSVVVCNRRLSILHGRWSKQSMECHTKQGPNSCKCRRQRRQLWSRPTEVSVEWR